MAEDIPSRTKVKKICITLNNYSEGEYDHVIQMAEKLAVFAVIGKEIGENGTPHLQVFINLKVQERWSAIKRTFPRAHIEKANGTDQQNLDYCTKQDKEAVIIGEPQTRGKRNDLKKACEKVLAHEPIEELALAYPDLYVKYSKGLQALDTIIQKPRDVNDPPLTIWIYGETGVGKTRFAYDQHPQEDIFTKDGSQWWDGYRNQKCILVDDFDGKWEFRDFLRFLDRYPYQGQIKGGYIKVNSPIIIITCEYPPETFWRGTSLAQVLRRLNHVVQFEKK